MKWKKCGLQEMKKRKWWQSARMKKEKIIASKNKLGRVKIYIDHDLIQGERKIREKVIDKARELREKGKKI